MESTKDKYLKTVTKEEKVTSADGISLTVYEGEANMDYGKRRTQWLVVRDDNGEYVDSVDNGIGKFYDFTYKELSSFEEYVSKFKSRYVNIKHHSFGLKDGFYTYRAYDIETQEDFKDSIKELEYLCSRDGINCAYNDEHGVGEISLNGDGKTYTIKHFRWGTKRDQKATLKEVADFLQSFHEIGAETVYKF